MTLRVTLRHAFRGVTALGVAGPAARADAHGIRANSQAIVVGAGTALRDAPRLTWRAAGAEGWAAVGADGAPPPQPLRVVLDARGRLTAGPLLGGQDEARTLVLTTAAAPLAARRAWDAVRASARAAAAARARALCVAACGRGQRRPRAVVRAVGVAAIAVCASHARLPCSPVALPCNV